MMLVVIAGVLALPGALMGWWFGRHKAPVTAALLGGLVALVSYYLVGILTEASSREGFMIGRWFTGVAPIAGVFGAIAGIGSARCRMRREEFPQAPGSG